MKKRYVLIALLCCLVIVAALGPRVRVETTIYPSPAEGLSGNALDDYLQKSEAGIENLRPSVEKTIVWANPRTKQKTPLALVYLHGFGASRQETAPVSENVAKQLGANLFYARLRGHGRDADAMAEATVNDWLNDAAEALAIGKQLGDQVVLIGSSTGGTLATWLALQEDNECLFAVVLMSPNFWPSKASSGIALLPWGNVIVRSLLGEYGHFKPANEAMQAYWTTTWHTSALLPMMGLVNWVDEFGYEKFTTPVLVIHSENDQVINPEKVVSVFEKMASTTKRRVVINNSEHGKHHILAGDALSPSTTEKVVTEIVKFLALVNSKDG